MVAKRRRWGVDLDHSPPLLSGGKGKVAGEAGRSPEEIRGGTGEEDGGSVESLDRAHGRGGTTRVARGGRRSVGPSLVTTRRRPGTAGGSVRLFLR